jgi:hypothetical protein
VVPFGSPIAYNAAPKDAEATKHPPGENATELRTYSSRSNRLARILEHPELELSELSNNLAEIRKRLTPMLL